MNNHSPVRWMVSFWPPDGGSANEPDFPEVEFWHPDRLTARAEAARVLVELREERNDERDWVSAGHPDPFEVGAGRHPGGQWILRYEDLKHENAASNPSAKKRRKGVKSAASTWKGTIDGKHLKRTLRESHRDQRSLEQIIEDSFKDVPQEEWDKLPHNLTDWLDYYLYGMDR